MIKKHDRTYLRQLLIDFQDQTGGSAEGLIESIDVLDYILMLRDRQYTTSEIIRAIKPLV